MKKKLLSALLCVAMTASMLIGCGSAEQAATETADKAADAATETTVEDTEAATTAEVEKVELKVWSPEDEHDITVEQCEAFAANHPEYEITFTYENVENADSITQLKNDPDVAADVFVYPTGGIPEMIEAGLIYPITVDAENVKSAYGENAIKSCSSDGVLYGIPQTPNAFFMYYNKSLFTEDDVKSIETMLAKDLGSDVKNFSFTISNSWYVESFFYANGGILYGEDGTDGTQCSWNDEKGVAVGKYLLDLVANDKYVEDIDGIAASMFQEGKLGAVCSGTWSSEDFKAALGDDLGATVLPTAEIDGKVCQLSNFADFKAYGVKSSTLYPKAAQQLAEWLGGEESQLKRFEAINMTPTVTALLENESVQANVAACALSEMTGKFSTPQPTTSQISQYWAPVEAFGKGIVNGDITEANLQESLDSMVEGVTTKLAE
ncbi:MAG: extracellular solute-binding protein [Acetatifactor sp.]|nr:extracellular solute-binding protein [Acetatifactor sp.]